MTHLAARESARPGRAYRATAVTRSLPAPETAACRDEAEDEALLAALRSGDPAAFERLVRAHGGRMLAVARRFLRNDEDAQDAVQEAFLSAFRSLRGFEGGARLSTWLHRIVVNFALMKIRSRKRRPEESIDYLLPRFKDDGHPVEEPREWRPDCEAQLASREIRDLVRRCIDTLPERYRMVLMMRDVEEMDTAEVAKALDATENAVKIRLHRARQALRAVLDPHFRSATG
jgi:RNA polymerase sigma-70 factor (ECF subfamily)